MAETRMFTTTEVATIFNMDRSTINAAARSHRIKPTDIVPSPGKMGYSYRYDEDAVRNYGKLIGRDPDFKSIGYETYDVDEEGRIILTKENIERVIHGETEEPKTQEVSDVLTRNLKNDTFFGFTEDEVTYIVKVGNGYISFHRNNDLYYSITPELNEGCIFKKEHLDMAREAAEKLGGRLLSRKVTITYEEVV